MEQIREFTFENGIERIDFPWGEIRGEAFVTGASQWYTPRDERMLRPSGSSRRPSAINGDGLPGDVPGHIAHEKLRSRSHLFDGDKRSFGHRFQHDSVDHFGLRDIVNLCLIFDLCIDQGRVDIRRTDRINRDINISRLKRNHLSETQ